MENLVGHIYILLSPSGKRYVGQTIQTIEQRMNQHWHDAKKDDSFPIHNAMLRYGKDNISVERSFPIYGEQKDLDTAEDEYILKYDTLAPNGYNIKRGGRGGSRGPCSETTKAKISATLLAHPNRYWLGKTRSEETRAKLSTAGKGRHRSEETKAKISLNSARKGKPSWNRGGHLSEETKLKKSIAMKEYWQERRGQ